MSTYPKTTTVSDLKIYPIKSCRGFSVQKSTLTRKGLKFDRCCMFIDAKGVFITIRDKPEMTLIKTALIEEEGQSMLQITFPHVEANGEGTRIPDYEKASVVSVPLEADRTWLETNTELVNAEIWQYETDVYAISEPSIARTISDYFTSWDKDANVRLVMKGPTPRPCRGNGDERYLGRKENVNFPDVLPIQVASEVSLRELNGRLSQAGAKEITIERFRPNVIVDSDNLDAWEEDEWKTLRINPPQTWLGSISTATGLNSESVDVDVSARCARCHVPNVDPETAIPDKKEPWGTLYKYRRVDEGIKFKPCFGMLCCPRSEGEIAVGMEVEIREVMSAAGGKGEHKYVKGF